MRRSTRVFALLGALLGLVTLVSACGSEEEDTPATTDPLSIEITVENGKVTPNGEVVEVEPGQEVRLDIKSDEEGELHVHSDPEQEHEYGAGTTRVSLGTFDTPGRFAVENHALHTTILTLEVK